MVHTKTGDHGFAIARKAAEIGRAGPAQRVTYSYDEAGNLTKEEHSLSGLVYTYTYDAENRMIYWFRPTFSVLTATLTYNGDHQRVALETIFDFFEEKTRFVHDGQNVLQEHRPDGTALERYQYMPQQYGLLFAESVAKRYYHFDGLGSTVNVTDAAETVVDAYEYEAFGFPHGDKANERIRYKWLGQLGYASDMSSSPLAEPTVPVYIRRRWYDHELGRWMSRDPLEAEADGTNLYRYGRNNPVLVVDPRGTLTITNIWKPIPGKCGGPSLTRYRYDLASPATCAGFLVQEITAYCDIKACFTRPAAKWYTKPICNCPIRGGSSQVIHFLEALEVTPPEQQKGDAASRPLLDKYCGLQTLVATVKFYCTTTTGDLTRWPKGTAGVGRGRCKIFAPDAHVFNLAGKRYPTWWNTKPVDGPAKRRSFHSWCCCPCPCCPRGPRVVAARFW